MGRAAVMGIVLVVATMAGCASSTPSRDPKMSVSPTSEPTPVTAPLVPDVDEPPAVAVAPAFTSAIATITPELADRMSASWRPGCPVPLEDLRYVTVTHRDAAEAVVTVFRALFEAGYPVRSLRLVDDFGASDDASMAADNTSAFNCRAITGGGGWSEHSYGTAIDLNPVE